MSLRLLSMDLADDQSTPVQVITWYRQATSHHLNQYWPSFMRPYGVTMPQCVNEVNDSHKHKTVLAALHVDIRREVARNCYTIMLTNNALFDAGEKPNQIFLMNVSTLCVRCVLSWINHSSISHLIPVVHQCNIIRHFICLKLQAPVTKQDISLDQFGYFAHLDTISK